MGNVRYRAREPGSMTLFDDVERERRLRENPWTPEPPPDLSNVKALKIDFETTGLKWWAGDRPIGAGVCLPNGTTQYLAWGHQGFGNQHDENVIRRWFHEQVKHKRITNANTRFEVHMAREWGVDFEEQGCEVSDVQHWAALLDDFRRKFSLEVLCEDFLPPEFRKVLSIGGEKIDGTRMATYPPGMIAIRACADVLQVHELEKVMWPLLTEQGLHRVRHLEDECIYAVCEMEKNAAPIDTDLLDKWAVDVEQELMRVLYHLQREVGFLFNPDSNESWTRLFEKCGLKPAEFTGTLDKNDNPVASFTDAYLKKIDHPWVQAGRKAGKLKSLSSKYFDKYRKTIGSDGLLRFALHQLRGDENGTITGRFSSSAIKIGSEKIGANVQQVLTAEKQREAFGDDYIVRALFIAYTLAELHAGKQGQVIAADAMQLEYRLFAHDANSSRINEAYKDELTRFERGEKPLSFHELTWTYIKAIKPDLAYKPLKNLNFCKLYGGGLAKIAFMMGFITGYELEELRRKYAPKGIPKTEPKLAQALEVQKIYERELPEVQAKLDEASALADRRGYVKTILGRRIRFPTKERLYKAFNGRTQGSGGDILKTKMVEVHKVRKKIGFIPRMTVHDEIVGTGEGPETVQELSKILNHQSFKLRVSILWDVHAGTNWAEAKGK